MTKCKFQKTNTPMNKNVDMIVTVLNVRYYINQYSFNSNGFFYSLTHAISGLLTHTMNWYSFNHAKWNLSNTHPLNLYLSYSRSFAIHTNLHP